MDKAYYKEYYVQERKHWWFLARKNLLENQVKKMSKNGPLKILNVGAATGATSQMLMKYGEVTSLEFDHDCCVFVREELKMEVIEGSILELPFETDSFDLVCAFDVVEHIEEDQTGVSELIRVCNKDGHVFVTVPAFMVLWSDHDVVNHHFRRYKIKQLRDLFAGKGRVEYASYFNFFLFLPILLARMLSNAFKKKNREVKSDFSKFKPGLLNNILYAVFLSEKAFLSPRISLPFGVSIMLVWKNEE